MFEAILKEFSKYFTGHHVLSFACMIIGCTLRLFGALKEKKIVPTWLDAGVTYVACILIFFIFSPIMHKLQIDDEWHNFISGLLGLALDDVLKLLHKSGLQVLTIYSKVNILNQVRKENGLTRNETLLNQENESKDN